MRSFLSSASKCGNRTFCTVKVYIRSNFAVWKRCSACLCEMNTNIQQPVQCSDAYKHCLASAIETSSDFLEDCAIIFTLSIAESFLMSACGAWKVILQYLHSTSLESRGSSAVQSSRLWINQPFVPKPLRINLSICYKAIHFWLWPPHALQNNSASGWHTHSQPSNLSFAFPQSFHPSQEWTPVTW